MSTRRTFLATAAGLAAGALLPATGGRAAERERPLVIDSHVHYTRPPRALQAFRDAQLAGLREGNPSLSRGQLGITDDEVRASLETLVGKQRARGIDMGILSPRAVGMAHHVGSEATSRHWAEHNNELVHRACQLFPGQFVGACQLPQSPGVRPSNSVRELERCVKELGFVGCVVNPDPSGGFWTDPPLTDRWWYPLYEWMVQLDVPALLHGSLSRNASMHTSGAHYMALGTAAFVQLVTSNLFRDFPSLRFVLPHGGGAVPYQWSRYRALLAGQGRPPPEELISKNVFFDTCVYDQAAMELLLSVIPASNLLFGTEMLGAMRAIDPRSGRAYDDTKRHLEAVEWLRPEERRKILGGNALRVFSRLGTRLGRA